MTKIKGTQTCSHAHTSKISENLYHICPRQERRARDNFDKKLVSVLVVLRWPSRDSTLKTLTQDNASARRIAHSCTGGFRLLLCRHVDVCGSCGVIEESGIGYVSKPPPESRTKTSENPSSSRIPLLGVPRSSSTTHVHRSPSRR